MRCSTVSTVSVATDALFARISDRAFRLYGAILYAKKATGRTDVPQTVLARSLGWSQQKVSRALAELRAAGLVVESVPTGPQADFQRRERKVLKPDKGMGGFELMRARMGAKFLRGWAQKVEREEALKVGLLAAVAVVASRKRRAARGRTEAVKVVSETMTAARARAEQKAEKRRQRRKERRPRWTSADAERLWRQCAEERFPRLTSVRAKWGGKQRKLAKTMIETYGEELARESIRFLFEHWGRLSAEWKVKGWPSVSIWYGFRESLMPLVESSLLEREESKSGGSGFFSEV